MNFSFMQQRDLRVLSGHLNALIRLISLMIKPIDIVINMHTILQKSMRNAEISLESTEFSYYYRIIVMHGQPYMIKL